MNDKIKQLLALAKQYSDEIGVIGVNIHPRLLSRIVRLDSTDLLDDSLMDDTPDRKVPEYSSERVHEQIETA